MEKYLIYFFPCQIWSRAQWQINSAETELKADWPDPRDYPHTPTDYKHADVHLGLVVMLLCSKLAVIALCCIRQSQAPNIDHFMSKTWPWPLNLTHDLDPTFDLELKARQQWCQNTIFYIWPWPLTYDLGLQSQHRSRSTPILDRPYQVHYLPALLQLRGR